jgi:hypothetical protein
MAEDVGKARRANKGNELTYINLIISESSGGREERHEENGGRACRGE